MSDAFILLSGPSINNLTQEEKEYIQSCTTISANRYLCFQDMIGIKPDYHIYVDQDQKTKAILRESINKYGDNKLKFYCNQMHKDFLDTLGENNWSVNILDKYSYSSFAQSLNERLFWCSIAGMAINLCHILVEENTIIKIVGMDGGLINHFWINQMKDNPEKFSKDAKQNLDYSEKNNHEVCNWWNETTTRIINKGLEKKNISFYNCNKDSYFVKSELHLFKPILNR